MKTLFSEHTIKGHGAAKRALILAILLMSILSACQDAGKISFEPRADVEARLTNYLIAAEFAGEDGVKTEMTELRCDEGYIWKLGDSILYTDYDGKAYQLYEKSKTGLVIASEDEEAYRKFGAVISSYIFFHDTYRNFDLRRVGRESIAGREASAYTFQYENQENKFWVDDEQDITMKFIAKTGALDGTMEVKEFRAGGVSLSDLVDLGEYTVTDTTN